MNDFVAFIKAVPELVGLYAAMKSAIEKAQLEVSIKQHLKEVADAYSTGDSSKLDDVFHCVRDSAPGA